MNLFGIGPTEIFVVLIVILVLFGPDKLPELAKKIGGASREIRDNLNSINEQMNTALETTMEMDKAQMIKPAPPADATAAPSDPSAAENTILAPTTDAAAAMEKPTSASETLPPT